MKQGTQFGSPLARWLNKVGMTSRELMRRIGYGSIAGLNNFLRGDRPPSLALMYEIERATEGGVPIEAWLSIPSVRDDLKRLRRKQPEAYQPKDQQPEGENASSEREEES